MTNTAGPIVSSSIAESMPPCTKPAGLQKSGLPSKPIRIQPSAGRASSKCQPSSFATAAREIVERGLDHEDLRQRPSYRAACCQHDVSSEVAATPARNLRGTTARARCLRDRLTMPFHRRFNTSPESWAAVTNWEAGLRDDCADSQKSFPMRTLLHKLANRLHAIEDHLTVRTQIAAAVATMCVVLVGTLAAGAALISYRDTAALVNRSVAGSCRHHIRPARPLHGGAPARDEPVLAAAAAAIAVAERPGRMRRALERVQQTFSDFAWIGFADVDGKVVASTGGLLQGNSVAQRPWFKEGLQRHGHRRCP